MKKLIILSALIMSAQSADAAWVICGKVLAVHNASNAVHFKTDVSDPNSPCLWKNTWELEKSHPEFEEIYKMLLTAQVTGSPLRVSGKSTCDAGGYKQKVGSFLLGTW